MPASDRFDASPVEGDHADAVIATPGIPLAVQRDTWNRCEPFERVRGQRSFVLPDAFHANVHQRRRGHAKRQGTERWACRLLPDRAGPPSARSPASQSPPFRSSQPGHPPSRSTCIGLQGGLRVGTQYPENRTRHIRRVHEMDCWKETEWADRRVWLYSAARPCGRAIRGKTMASARLTRAAA